MPEISIKAEEIFSFFGFSVTNALLTSWVVFWLLCIFALWFRGRIHMVPGWVQNIVEITVEAIFKLMEEVLGSRKDAKKYFPFIATIFLFILLNNWLGLVPLVGSVGIHETHQGKEVFVPLFRSAAADLNFTLMFALVSVFTVNVLGIVSIGFFKHMSKFFTLSNPINFFVGLLEFIGEITKIISFSFRLFGNIFAGEVLLIIIYFILPFLLPVPFLMLEVFVGFIQALVFAMLTLVFIAMAVRYEH